MNSFPVINNNLIVSTFDKIVFLYTQDKVKLLDAAVRATATENFPFIISPNAVDPQIDIVRNKLTRKADNYGQRLFIKIVEELYDELCATGATGVNKQDFLDVVLIVLEDHSKLKYVANKKWYFSWDLDLDGYERQVEFGLRGRHLPIQDIVPDYVLQYVQQSMYAFKNKRHAASLALMTIALEGTLRDALKIKGYTYQHGASSQDLYQIEDIHVHKDANGYRVTFPTAMPISHANYLSAPGDPNFKSFKIKRVKRGNSTFLEIRQVSDLLDYWSSNTVVTQGTAQITGLGAAIDISRNQAGILTPIDLPVDFDGAIQAVRNNLIHLSGDAMLEEVDLDAQGNPVTLGDFLKDKNKVFDAVCTIGDAINKIYERIAAQTL